MGAHLANAAAQGRYELFYWRKCFVPACEEANMSECEIRQEHLAAVLADIEAETRRLGRKVLIPAALGAGLALGAGGCGNDSTLGPTADTDIPRDAAVRADTWLGCREA